MKSYDYEQTLKLKNDEIGLKLNVLTGEIKEVSNKPNNIPKDKQFFGREETGWRKSFDYSWEFLEEVLSDLELRVVQKLCRLAEMNTNSLKPLNDETTQVEIAKTFNIDHRKSKRMFKKLHELGIYAKFDIVYEHIPYTKFWVLNPYLSFGGKLIKSDISELFKGTKLTNEYYKRLESRK